MLRRTLILLCLAAFSAFAADLTGKWDLHVETDAGSGDPTFEFKQTGDKLTGTYNGTFGTAPVTGTVKGDDVEFSVEVMVLDQKGTIVYKGKIAADGKMKGDVEITGLGKGTWTGTKKS
jgi:hypothetical protein